MLSQTRPPPPTPHPPPAPPTHPSPPRHPPPSSTTQPGDSGVRRRAGWTAGGGLPRCRRACGRPLLVNTSSRAPPPLPPPGRRPELQPARGRGGCRRARWSGRASRRACGWVRVSEKGMGIGLARISCRRPVLCALSRAAGARTHGHDFAAALPLVSVELGGGCGGRHAFSEPRWPGAHWVRNLPRPVPLSPCLPPLPPSPHTHWNAFSAAWGPPRASR